MGGEEFYEVVIKRDVGVPWQDCRTEKGGADFFKTSGYLIGRVLGYGHSDNPDSVMYPLINLCR